MMACMAIANCVQHKNQRAGKNVLAMESLILAKAKAVAKTFKI